MTNSLQQVIDEVSLLPVEEQETFAAWMLIELRSEQRWNELFARSQDMLARMAEEALAEHRAGKTLPLDPEKL
jgi:hypothetical protein